MAAPRDARATLLVVAGLIVAVVGLATIGVHAHISLGVRAAEDGFLAAICLAGAAVGIARYRSTGDTHPLFVGAGLLSIAIQTALFDQHWIFTAYHASWDALVVPSVAWFAAWALAAIGFNLALPWWDRRGRAPIRAPSVIVSAIALLACLDLILIAFHDSFRRVTNDALTSGMPFANAEIGHRILGVAAIVLLAIAAWREWRAGGDLRSPHPWLTTAWIVSAAGQVVLLAWPVAYRRLIVPADVLPSAGAALALIAFLAPQRAEASRARRATDQAQLVMGGRAEIAAMIAHEVRGPVTTIRGLAGTALAHYERLGDPERREFFDLIEQESRRLLATVTQASTALKVDASSVNYDIRPQDLAATVREGIALAEVGVHPVSVAVPDGVETPLDRRWVAEVVRQLVDNAAKFSPPETSISVDVRADEGWVTIEVSDKGPGIPADQRDAVFQKFTTWRPDGYETAAGSGLGLFMVRGIVQAHHGTIHVVDAPGDGGTMLRVRLPMEE